MDPRCRPAPWPAPKERAELQPSDWRLASRGKHLTCETQLTLHKQLPPALNNCLVHLAPPVPIAVLPLLALPYLFTLTGCRASCMGASERPAGDATPNLVQTHVMAGSAAPNAMLSAPPDAALPPDDASEASDVSVATVSSSNCDPQSPDEVPVIAAPDLAAVLGCY